MPTKGSAVAFLGAVVVAGSVALDRSWAATEARPAARWEYRVTNSDELFEKNARWKQATPFKTEADEGNFLRDELNRFGDEGWELVTSEGGKYVFKRAR